MIPRPVTSVRAVKVRPTHHTELPEHVATEEPMQILVAGPGQDAGPLAVTMRTPGHDFELAAGFVVTEGVVAPEDLASVDYCEAVDDLVPEARYNHVSVRLKRDWSAVPRYFTASASCGMCGKTSIDQIETSCPAVAYGTPIPSVLIPTLPDRLRPAQTAFDRTGGLHAAGLFSPAGELVCAREDVGRHNAVDKVVGHLVLHRPGPVPADLVLAVSGRVSFEIVQKAAMAGIGTIAAVSAPSSLAVTAADRLGVTLAAFVRGGTYNVYSHPGRIDFRNE
ncbi:MAG TPA: formate dehydrogenase accessory sulfurtransferase FdhD [Acidimicrobiales bacterium]|jgi:FdhD protein|nr:formate dehydrogenase accessory sulfurtransferase FdhD [Acidimicrobiales bacterium]